MNRAIETAKTEDVPFFYPLRFKEASQVCLEGLELYNQGKRGVEIRRKFDSALHQIEIAIDNTHISKIVLKQLLKQRNELIDSGILKIEGEGGRSSYFDGRFLDAKDFRDEQAYHQGRNAEKLLREAVLLIEKGTVDGMWLVDFSTDSDQHRWRFKDGKIFVINPMLHEQGGSYKRSGDKISFESLVDGWNQISEVDGKIVDKKDRVFIKTIAKGSIISHYLMQGTFREEDIDGKLVSSGAWKAMKYVRLDG